MTTTLATFRNQVDENLGDKTDTAIYDSAARDVQIQAAVETYSRDVPRLVASDVTGDAGHYYPLTGESKVLASWVDDFSQIVAIEYPAAVVASDELPQYLEPEDWRDDYEASSVVYLLLPNHAPAATEKLRVTYTAPHVFTSAATTTPTQHFYAICYLAAAYCCRAIAASYSNTSDSTISADSVAHTSKAGEFSRRAAEFAKLYREALGLDGGKSKTERPAAAFVDWDTSPSWPAGRDYVYHRNR